MNSGNIVEYLENSDKPEEKERKESLKSCPSVIPSSAAPSPNPPRSA